MAITIDKNMYEELMGWRENSSDSKYYDKDNQIMYVNSNNRALTNATIKKIMFEMDEDDPHGELYTSFYSSGNFYNHMREFYTKIATLYFHTPGENDNLSDIISHISPTCYWITLIIKNMEELSDEPEKVHEMMKSLITFSEKGAYIILIGNGDYKEVFRNCDYVLQKFSNYNSINDESHFSFDFYEQEKIINQVTTIYETIDKQRDELIFYWKTLYEQLNHNYFDYAEFKPLYKETLEFIIPRISEESIYRNDLLLIENISRFHLNENDKIDGCKPWEFDAAKQFTRRLYLSIAHMNYGFTENSAKIALEIQLSKKEFGSIHADGYLLTTININPDNVEEKIDKLSNAIKGCTYYGDFSSAANFIRYEKKK